MCNPQPTQQSPIRQVVPGDQSDVGVIRLQESLQGGCLGSDRGDVKFSPALEGARQELGLKKPGVSDEDLHEFGFSGAGLRSNVHNMICFHCIMMPERARNRCRPHHIGLVMNPRSLSTFVELRSYTGFAAALSGRSLGARCRTQHGCSIGRFHHFSGGHIAPRYDSRQHFPSLVVLEPHRYLRENSSLARAENPPS